MLIHLEATVITADKGGVHKDINLRWKVGPGGNLLLEILSSKMT